MKISKDIMFDIIKNNALALNKNAKEYGAIPHFFEDYSQQDFEELKLIADKIGFKVKKACDIISNDEHYQNLWNNEKSLIIYWKENNL